MMSQIPCKQSIRIEKSAQPVTSIVTNLKQKIPFQITGKIMFKPTGLFYSYQLFTGNL